MKELDRRNVKFKDLLERANYFRAAQRVATSFDQISKDIPMEEIPEKISIDAPPIELPTSSENVY